MLTRRRTAALAPLLGLLLATSASAQKKIYRVKGKDGQVRFVTLPDPPKPPGEAAPETPEPKKASPSTPQAPAPLFPGNREFGDPSALPGGAEPDAGPAAPKAPTYAERLATAKAAVESAKARLSTAEEAYVAAIHKARVVPDGRNFHARTLAGEAVEEAKADLQAAQQRLDTLSR